MRTGQETTAVVSVRTARFAEAYCLLAGNMKIFRENSSDVKRHPCDGNFEASILGWTNEEIPNNTVNHAHLGKSCTFVNSKF